MSFEQLKTYFPYRLLASREANLAQVDRQGDSGVVWAARQGHVDVIKYLVAQGVHLNMQNKVGKLKKIIL